MVRHPREVGSHHRMVRRPRDAGPYDHMVACRGRQTIVSFLFPFGEWGAMCCERPTLPLLVHPFAMKDQRVPSGVVVRQRCPVKTVRGEMVMAVVCRFCVCESWKFVGYGMRVAAMPPFDKSRKKDGSQVVMLRPFDFLKRINCHKVSRHVCTVDNKLALSEPLIPFDIQLDEFASKLRSYKLQVLGQAILHSAISAGSPHGGGDPGARQISSVGITERDKVVEKSEPVHKSDLAPRSLTNTVSKRLAPGLKRWQGPVEASFSRHDGGSEVCEDPDKTEDDLSVEQHVLERNTEGNEGHDEDEDDQFAGYDGGDGDEQGVRDSEEGVEDEDGGDDDDGGDDEEDGDDHRGLKDGDDDEETGVGEAEDKDSYEAGSEGVGEDVLNTQRLEYDDDGNAIDRPVQVFVDVRKILPNPDNGEFQYNHRPLNEMLVASIKDSMERPEKQKEWDRNTFILTPVIEVMRNGQKHWQRLKPKDWRDEDVNSYHWYVVAGQNTVDAAKRLERANSRAARKWGVQSWKARAVYFDDDHLDGYAYISTFDNTRETRYIPLSFRMAVTAIRGLWRHMKFPKGDWHLAKTKDEKVAQQQNYHSFLREAIRMTPDTKLWNQSLNNKFVHNWSNLLRPFMCLATTGNAVWQLVNRFFDMWEKGELPGQDGVRPVDQEGRPGEASGAGPTAKIVKRKKELVHYVQSNKSPNGYYVCVHDPAASAWKVFGDFTAREKEMALDLILAGKVVVTTGRTFAKKLMNMNDLYTEVRRERYMVCMFNYVLFKSECRGQREWNENFFIGYDDIMKRFQPHWLTKDKWEKKKMKLPIQRTNNEGKSVLLMGNVQSGSVWDLLRSCRHVVACDGSTTMLEYCSWFIDHLVHNSESRCHFERPKTQHWPDRDMFLKLGKKRESLWKYLFCNAPDTRTETDYVARKVVALQHLQRYHDAKIGAIEIFLARCEDLWFDARIYNEALKPEDRFDMMDNEEDTDDDEIDLPLPDARNHAADKNMRTGSLSGGDPAVVEVGGPTMASCKTAQLTHTQTSSAGDGTEASTSKWKDKRGAPGFPTRMRQMFDHIMEMPTENQTRGQHDDAGPEEDDMCLEDNPLFHIPDDEDKDLTPGDEIESHMKESKGGPHVLNTKFTETEGKRRQVRDVVGKRQEIQRNRGEKKTTTDEDAGDAGDGGAQRVRSGLGDPLSAANTGMSSHGGWSGWEHDAGDALVFGGASPRDTTEPLTDNRDEGDKLMHMVCTGSGSQIAPDSMEREEGGGMEGVPMTHGRDAGNDDEEADGDANLEHNMDVDSEDGLGKEASCCGRSGGSSSHVINLIEQSGENGGKSHNEGRSLSSAEPTKMDHALHDGAEGRCSPKRETREEKEECGVRRSKRGREKKAA
ncbi:hypothetical protein CBR_g17042 [Chara braunii]|uniref:Uncharacterized protein n=1 Tax=Chara braunii TaxID=69332 RepID=A0A388KUG8_CHABU|nr:hypothetical protein CBR_g17042 [Chara braunii]|eukprot:GBG73701.1 hypothetical protein CBR_g17042 [Chara braunii]